MKKNLIMLLSALILNTVWAWHAFAQCKTREIKPQDPLEGCEPYPFKACLDTSGTYYEWNWGDGTGSSGTNLQCANHLYNTRGTYPVTVVVTYPDGSKCTTLLAKKVTVYGPPTAIIVIPPTTRLTQCFEENGVRNSFQFKDGSLRSKDNRPIVSWEWKFGDGAKSYEQNPKHSYDAGGSFDVSVLVTDDKGCSQSIALNTKIRVLKNIKAEFKAKGVQNCVFSDYTLDNISDTFGMNITKFYWDYEDDGIWDDSTQWSGKKIRVTAPSQTARLRLVNRLGCEDDTTYSMLNFIPKLKVWFKDTVCWEDAKKGIQFHAEEIKGATFFAWNFDDAPDPTSITPFVWEPVHKFTLNGPKNYNVKFHVDHPICGSFDTCFVLHVKGPAARIRLASPPYSPNDYVPTQKKMPAVYFSLLNNGISAFPGSCDSIPYAYFTPVTKTVTKKVYCNTPYNKVLQNIIYCEGTSSADTQQYLSAMIQLNPAVTTKTVSDSVEVWAWYHANDPLPKNPYFRSTGTQRFGPNIHDTDLYTCKMPNLVRFSNFSIKYRLHKQIDDNPVAYTQDNKTWDIPTETKLDPGTTDLTVNLGWPYANTEEKWSMTVNKTTYINLLTDLPIPPLFVTNGYIDECVNKNFPYASDSLRYFWDFGDGSPCTSSVNNNDWNCRYSVLVSPYHMYKTANPTGCTTATLNVYDDVMGCHDKATQLIRQIAPDAWWDRGVNGYRFMTWELQQQNAFKPATPEDETDAFPHLGLRLGIPNQKLNCTGTRYRFDIEAAEQILPTCGAQKFWIVFDSAAAVIDTFCKVGSMKIKYRDYGFLPRNPSDPAAYAVRGISKGYPVGGPDGFWAGLPWKGQYWWAQGDTGCKTIGFVLKNGDCYDTAWYHDYICFTRLSPQFSVTRIDTLFSYVNSDPINGAITGKTVNFVPVGTSLDPAEGHLGYRYPHVNVPYRLSTHKREREGTDILLLPLDRNMPRVTKFFYTMQRRELPAAEDFYYHMQKQGDLQHGIWPDSASMNPYRVKPLSSDTDACRLWARTYNKDSVTSIKDTIYYTKYDLTHNLYTIRYTLSGSVTTDTNVIDGTRFFLLTKEYKELKNKGVFYLPYNDMRARPFGWKTPYGGIPIYYHSQAAGTVPVEDTSFFLSFTDPIKDDSREYNDGNLRFAMHDSVKMHVPFPGFYTIVSEAINADGCDELSSYNFIHGHFATFWIKGTDAEPLGDSIICVNDTVRFLRKVRYWTTQCPPLPSGVLPEACLSGPGAQDGTITLGEAATATNVPLYPWDFPDPVAYRKTLLPSYEPSKSFRKETVEWNYGDDNIFYFEGTPGKFGEGFHKYSKPGVYDVTMRTRDSLGYYVYTTRRKLINVVKVDADFVVAPLRDTHSICAPKNIVYHDRTKLLGSDVDAYGRFYNKSKVIAKKGTTGCYEVIEKPFLMDSISAWTWSTGQKNQDPITRTETDTMTFDYRANGQYDVWLEVVSTNLKPHKCSDKETKKKYIRIDGPRPSFELLDTAGCVPFIARVRNTSTNSATYNWYQGDGKVVVSGTLPKDSIVKLRYLTPGKFKVTLIQQDTIFDPVLNKWVNCTSPVWPDSIVDRTVFWVTVYPFSPLHTVGDTVVCPDAPAKYTATSKYGEFRKWEWKTSDGQHYNSANKNDSSAIFTWSKPGKYQVIVKGETEKNCEISDTIEVRVDSVHADFSIDTANARLGRFIFVNKSVNGKSYKWIMKNQDNGKTLNTEDKNDMSPVSYEFADLEPKDETEADNINDLTEFHFQICLVATSPIGCTDTICREVKFPRAWKPWNVITPDDNDGKNDVFDPHIKGETEYNIEIFNRWGEKVFSSTSSDNDWNGRVNNTGATCPAGTYYYVWKFKLVGGVEKTVKGTVTLLRN